MVYGCLALLHHSDALVGNALMHLLLFTLMHQALHRRCPAYFANLVAFSSTDSHRQFRSTSTRAAAIQRTRTQFGRRAFSVCGPDVWNSLPPSVRTVDSTRRSDVLSKLICSSSRLIINCFYFLFLFLFFILFSDYVMHGRSDFI